MHRDEPSRYLETATETGSDDAEIASLLAARLCHDLSGPVGAVAAGCELLNDGDPSLLTKTADLLSRSSASAVTRLRVLRTAFGTPGGTLLPLVDCMTQYKDAVHGTAVNLVWRKPCPPITLTPAQQRVVVNAIVLALDVCPGRGMVHVSLAPVERALDGVMLVSDAGGRITVDVAAPRLEIPEAMMKALSGGRRGLTSRTVQAYWLHLLTAARGGVDVAQSHDHISLSAWLPSAKKAGF